MSDRTSSYRQIRLIISPSMAGTDVHTWSVHALSVSKGIPTTKVLDEGTVLAPMPSTPEQVVEAVIRCADKLEQRWMMDPTE